MAKKKKLTLAQRAKRDPELLARALKNPGLRSKLPTSMLSPEMRQQRRLNERLRAPITPGSTMTERELARETDAAANVRYGPLEQQQKQMLGEEQARARDVGGFYDQYLEQIRQHTQNVNNIGAQAVQAGLAAQQGVGGLAAADLNQLQGQANAGAATTGMGPAGNLTGLANQAAAVRQALVGSFVAQQAGTNAATSNYASNLSNAVVPTQKLGAQVQAQGRVRQAREDIAATAREKGAYTQQERGLRRSEEAKHVLAQQTLAGNLQENKTESEQAQQRIDEQERHNRAQEKAANRRMRDARQKALDQAASAGSKRATSGPFAGLTQSQINGLSDSDARKLVNEYQDKGGAKGKDKRTPEQKYADRFYKKYGVRPATRSEVSGAKNQISEAGTWLGKIKGDIGAAGRVLTVGRPADKKKGDPEIPKLPAVFVRAAMDIKQHGFITPATANRLHREGYSVRQLGLPSGSAPKNPPPKPTFNPGGSLGGLP